MAVPNLRFTGFDGDWKESRLKDLALKITDGTHDTPVVQKEGIPFLTAINVKDGFINYDDIGYVDEITHKKIYERCNPEKDDLLIVNIGAGTATCARNIVDYQFSLKNVALVKPNRNLLNPIFLEQIQRKNSSRLFTSLTSGGAQPFLSLKEIGKLLIKYPSLEEQTKIASFLSNVDEKISQLMQKHALLSQYKQGMMQKLFSQQIRFKADDGSEFGEWEEKLIKDIADVKGGKRIPKGYPLVNENTGHPYITVSDMNRSYSIDSTNIRYVPLEVVDTIKRYTITDKDIFISVAGTLGIIGKIPTEFNGANLTENADKLTNLKCHQDFLIYLLDSGYLSELIESTATTSAQPKLALYAIEQLEVQIPCPEEQTKIANFLSAIDQKIEVVAQQIEQAKTWKKGLLQQMFV